MAVALSSCLLFQLFTSEIIFHIPYVIFVCKFLFDFGHEALTEALDKYMYFLTC